jgi:hypothetical protein
VADLLSTPAGINTLNRIACFLGRKWSSRNMERAFWRAFKQWETTGYFDRSVMLHELNPIVQDDIESLDNFLASIGCLDTVESNTTIYVDSVNGSDLTGDGSFDYPYASLDFLACYTRKINANFRVLLLNDLDMGIDPLNLDFDICSQGCFSIGGVGAPSVVTTGGGAGPFAVTGVVAWGAPPNDYGYQLQVAAGGWAPYELIGKWLRWESGANAGEVYPVNVNDATHVCIRGGLEAVPINGDTFSIIEPTITLSCQTVNIECSGPDNVLTATQNASRFNMFNLVLDLTGSLPPYNTSRNFVLHSDLESQISFVTISTESKTEPIFIESNLNRYRSCDNDIATYLHASIDNIDGAAVQGSQCGVLFHDPDPGSVYNYNWAIIKGAEFVRCIECYGVIEITKSNIDLQLCGIGEIRGDGGTCCQLSRCAISASGVDAIKLLYCGEWTIDRTVLSDFFGAQNFLWIIVGVVHLHPSTIDYIPGVVFAGYSVFHNRGNAQIFCDTDPTLISGGTGDIWYSGGVGATAFPAADAMATDNLGNTFSYISTP